jgi:hypothetical protein
MGLRVLLGLLGLLGVWMGLGLLGRVRVGFGWVVEKDASGREEGLVFGVVVLWESDVLAIIDVVWLANERTGEEDARWRRFFVATLLFLGYIGLNGRCGEIGDEGIEEDLGIYLLDIQPFYTYHSSFRVGSLGNYPGIRRGIVCRSVRSCHTNM